LDYPLPYPPEGETPWIKNLIIEWLKRFMK
jgi:hypothetical protein